ncbi:peptide-methionine (R)-S-oxide reductase, partial [Achromobacter ruhlandii]
MFPRAYPYTLTDAEWRARLTQAQYDVLRREGTERPYTSPLNDEHRAGTFACAGCAQKLFSSATKFDSGTGWPSFWQPLEHAVDTPEDRSFGLTRTALHRGHRRGPPAPAFDASPRTPAPRPRQNATPTALHPQPRPP